MTNIQTLNKVRSLYKEMLIEELKGRIFNMFAMSNGRTIEQIYYHSPQKNIGMVLTAIERFNDDYAFKVNVFNRVDTYNSINELPISLIESLLSSETYECYDSDGRVYELDYSDFRLNLC